MTKVPDLSVVLLHDRMVDKTGKLVTTSLTLIDIHDIARSSKTFGVQNFFVAHPAPALRKLARTLQSHWDEGWGATYNPNRKEALEHVQIATDLDEVIAKIDARTGKLPILIATSAKDGGERIDFPDLKAEMTASDSPYLLMLGTGWGMSDELLERASRFLLPLKGPGEYNHLSVRSACAIMLDRLMGR